jgi:hypothetical protein
LILSLGLSDHSAVSLSKSIELQMNPDVDVFPYFPCISSHLFPWYMSVPGKLKGMFAPGVIDGFSIMNLV